MQDGLIQETSWHKSIQLSKFVIALGLDRGLDLSIRLISPTVVTENKQPNE